MLRNPVELLSVVQWLARVPDRNPVTAEASLLQNKATNLQQDGLRPPTCRYHPKCRLVSKEQQTRAVAGGGIFPRA